MSSCQELYPNCTTSTKWLPVVTQTPLRNKKRIKKTQCGLFNTIRPSDSNKRCILLKSLACYCCLIRDSLDTSAKVGLLKWRFSLFSSFCDARIWNVKDTRPKRRWRFRPRIFRILSIFPRLVEPLIWNMINSIGLIDTVCGQSYDEIITKSEKSCFSYFL